MFFSTHARSVTILYRGDDLEKSMSHYLVEQLAIRPNINVRFQTEVIAAHGEQRLEAIDVRDSLSGETERLASDGLFIFIGADAETGWLPDEIALDRRGWRSSASALPVASSTTRSSAGRRGGRSAAAAAPVGRRISRKTGDARRPRLTTRRRHGAYVGSRGGRVTARARAAFARRTQRPGGGGVDGGE
jgi:hypothetical protein